MAAVQRYTAGMSQVLCVNVHRFLLFTLYSLYATTTFQLVFAPLSEFTLAVGVGDGGIQFIDDVQCFVLMHVRLSLLPRAKRVLWTIIAHSVVRPHLIEALCDLVVLRAYALTKESIISCIESLARRFGRGSDWKKFDVFGLASTRTLAGCYCGSKVLWQQLQDTTALEKLAKSIASLRPNVYFSDVV